MRTAIWWVRRDLRLADNQALTVALNQAEQVLPVLEPRAAGVPNAIALG